MGDLVEIGATFWASNIRAARISSDILVEEYVQIENISNIRHLVLELEAGSRDFDLDSDDISRWQQALANFSSLETLKIIIIIPRRHVRGPSGKKKKQELESVLSDLRAYFRYPDQKTPETAIEMS